jgi:hypothetical protein
LWHNVCIRVITCPPEIVSNGICKDQKKEEEKSGNFYEKTAVGCRGTSADTTTRTARTIECHQETMGVMHTNFRVLDLNLRALQGKQERANE